MEKIMKTAKTVKYLFAIRTDGGEPIIWKEPLATGLETETIRDFFDYADWNVSQKKIEELVNDLLNFGTVWYTHYEKVATIKRVKCEICLTMADIEIPEL